MRFALRRLGFFAGTLWACLTLNFVLPRLMPGSPIADMMAKYHGHVSVKTLQAIEVAFGVDTHASLISQYFQYLGNTATGNFGMSLTQTEPVSQVIAGAVWWTVGLIGVTTILAFILGTLIGIVGAWRRGGWLDGLLPPVFVITSSIPFFWIGMLLILFVGRFFPTFPTSGAYSVSATPGLNGPFVGDVLQHALLPALAILITSIGGWILTMRNTMVTVLAEDYVRMARAKGLPGWRIMFDYAARNAMLPNLSGFAMSLGFVLSGAIVVEYLFNYQGVGYYLLLATVSQDYALVQALFLLITVAVLIAILFADILTAILDPRTRTGGLAVATMQMNAALPVTPAGERPAGRIWRAIRSNGKATTGAVILLIFATMSVIPGEIASDNPSAFAYGRSLGPSLHHLLGTTATGQDIYSQVIWGARETLIIALVSGVLSTLLSMIMGIAAAYLGGWWDHGLNLITDTLLVIPTLPLLIVIIAYYPRSSLIPLIAVLVITGYSYGARQLRAEALSLRGRDFLEAARVRGERRLYMIFVEIIPSMTSLIMAVFLGTAVYNVIAAATLQFIGFGNPDSLSWGTMLYNAQNGEALQTNQYLWAIAPGLCIALLGAAFALLNYAFDEIGNPALQRVSLRRSRYTAPWRIRAKRAA